MDIRYKMTRPNFCWCLDKVYPDTLRLLLHIIVLDGKEVLALCALTRNFPKEDRNGENIEIDYYGDPGFCIYVLTGYSLDENNESLREYKRWYYAWKEKKRLEIELKIVSVDYKAVQQAKDKGLDVKHGCVLL